MHLVTIHARDGLHPGVKLGSRILDLAIAPQVVDGLPALPGSVRAILAGGTAALTAARAAADRVAGDEKLAAKIADAGGLRNKDDMRQAAPVPDPRLIVSCGRNSRLHAAELAIDKQPPAPARPSGFLKNPGAVIGPGEAIVLPPQFPDMVDWEAEFCAVIGRECHNISAAEAPAYIAGYTMINDVTARNFLPEANAQGKRTITADAQELILLGKQLPTFCPMGPAVVTADEIADPTNVNFSLSVNGKIMQAGNSGDVFFSLTDLVAYYSTFYTFRPGDIVTIGTPAGTGFSRSPPIFLKDGDKIEITCDILGSFINPVTKS